MIMLSILKKKHFNKCFNNTHVFFFPNLDKISKTNYCSDCRGPSPLLVRLIKQQASSVVHSVGSCSVGACTSMTFIKSKRCFKTLQPRMYHSKGEAFLKKMDFFFQKSTNQKFFLAPGSMPGNLLQPKLSLNAPLFPVTDCSLHTVQNFGVFFNEIVVADKLSRKTRKTNMQISVLDKITCSYTGKELISSPTNLSLPMCALTFLSGQHCTTVWAKKSVSSWKLRKNCVIGCKVTLRRKFAYVFLDKLYLYGRQGILERKKNFLNHFDFCFGVSKNRDFIELQKSDGLSSSFSGFSVSIK